MHSRASGWTPELRREFEALARAGRTAMQMTEVLGLGIGPVSRELSLWRAERGVATERDVCERQTFAEREAAMLRQVCADGGFPKAVQTPAGVVWLDMHDRPWTGPRPPPAKPKKTARAA